MNKVRKLFTPILTMGVMVVCLTACERMALPEDLEMNEKEANSLLQVRTRMGGGNEESVVSYPVNVYVFKGEKCVALQSITDAEQTLSIALTEGTYAVYAIGGATTENYVLPTQENATSPLTITLKEGKKHGDLMVAKSNVTLVDGGTNTLTLALERKVMLLQSVTLNSIPSAATAVTVTISPLWQRLEGTNYAGEEGSTTIALSKQADNRTWTFTGEEYLLPPAGNSLTIAVNIVTPSGTSAYSYNTSEQLEASGKVNIQGTYTEAVGVTLKGTITGATWTSEKTISFKFDESGSQTADNGNEDETNDHPEEGNEENNDDKDILTGTIPNVGDTYQSCYVLDVKEDNGIAEVLLLSPHQEKKVGIKDNEEQESVRKKIDKAMPSCMVEGISGWRLMTKAEAEILHSSADANLTLYNDWGLSSSYRYLIDEEGTIKTVKMGSGTFGSSIKISSTDILRPVTIIKIKKT